MGVHCETTLCMNNSRQIGMCGIVGIYLKNEDLRPELGDLLAAMLVEMSDRGPDSAGIALYRDPVPDSSCKLTLHAAGHYEWDDRFASPSASESSRDR